MGFILLILISLTAFISVETQHSASVRKTLEARQNAQLSLILAVGNLQKYAGEDQRATARADISPVNSANPFWTGVWNSNDTSQSPAWIVSGNEALSPDDPNYQTPSVALPDPAPPYNTVWLIDQSVNDPSDRVKVSTVELNDANGVPTGKIAYWVGDEGLKAKFNIESEDNTPSSSRTGSPTTLAYQFGINQIDTRFSSLDIEEDSRTGRALSLNELSLLADDSSIARNYRHDLTAYSEGLLTDSRNGGFKKDLTFAFADDGVFNMEFGANPAGADRYFLDLIEPSTGRTGPNWTILKNYYSLYRQVGNTANIDLQVPNPALNTAMRTDYVPYKHGTINDFWHYKYTDTYHRNNPVTPVMSRLQLDFGIKTELHGGAGQYKIEIQVRPMFGIYNPYNVAINDAAYQIHFELNPSFELVVDGTSYTFDFDDQNVLTYGSNYLNFLVETPSGEYIDFQPGETRLFAPLHRKLLKNTSNGVNEDYILRNTYTQNGSLFFTVRDKSGNIIYADPTSVIQIREIDIGEDAFVWLRGGPSRAEAHSIQRIKRLWQDSSLGPKLIDSNNPPAPNTAQDLATGRELASWAFNMQTSKSDYGLRNGIDSNLRTLQGNPDWDGFRSGNGNILMSGFSYQGEQGLLSSPLEPETFNNTRYSGRWGNTIRTEGQGHVVLFDIPREPLLSLGALQHANLSRYNHQPSFIIGNSYANPRIKANDTESIGFGGLSDLDIYDLPYLINEQVWDSYFFSSIDPNLSNGQIENLIANKKYRNKRYAFSENASDLTAIGVFDDAKTDIDDFHALASYMTVNGPFNVNSTSVEAWISVLSSMDNLALPVHEPTTNTTTVTTGNLFFTRLSNPYGLAYKTIDNSGFDNFWRGYQELTTTQITDLATEIVRILKARGSPFGTLADFVNRSLIDLPDTTEDERLSGILQQAIDTTSTNINSNIDPNLTDSVGVTHGSTPFLTTTSGQQASGTPGHLLQGDLLQALGPILTTRSDTFVVRAYGDSRSEVSNDVQSTAYCEAIVQRMSEPVEGDPNSSIDRNDPPGTFGRQFKIVSLRWLSPDEV
ncbi:hypothetical protein [Puniceicoccus vermicola]|nr:hypothetical protein [Puniceicoccus vermicola]